IIHDAVGDDAEIIFGAGNDPAMHGEVRVTVIATGFDRAVGGDQPLSRASGTRDPGAAERLDRSARNGDPDIHPPADGLMRLVRVGAAGAILCAAAAFATAGRWPWHPLPAPAAVPIVARPVVAPLVETVDTLRRGETLSELLARHGVMNLDLSTLGPALALDPRRLRSGLVFSFRRTEPDTLPSHISVRTGPEQRVVFRRVADGWDAAAEPIAWRTEQVRIDGAIDNSLYEALDAQVGDDQLDGPDRQRLAWDLAA